MVQASPIERSLDAAGVLDTHSDHSQAGVGSCARVLQDQLDNFFDLCASALFGADPRYVGHKVVREGRRASWAWECNESLSVYVSIRKGDERLVAASVVPVERPCRLEERGHDIQDALESSDFGNLVLVDFPFTRREESGGRKLVAIAGDYGLSPAEQGRRCVLW
jgi:hypothetical protein